MTHPLAAMLNNIKQQETAMTSEAEERREGYADGMAGTVWPRENYGPYYDGYSDGNADHVMLRHVAEWKRRAAIAPTSQNG